MLKKCQNFKYVKKLRTHLKCPTHDWRMRYHCPIHDHGRHLKSFGVSLGFDHLGDKIHPHWKLEHYTWHGWSYWLHMLKNFIYYTCINIDTIRMRDHHIM